MSSENFSRRQFLRDLSRQLTTASGLNLAFALANQFDFALAKEEFLSTKNGYKIAPWTGDDFTTGHKLRNHELPEFPKNLERDV